MNGVCYCMIFTTLFAHAMEDMLALKKTYITSYKGSLIYESESSIKSLRIPTPNIVLFTTGKNLCKGTYGSCDDEDCNITFATRPTSFCMNSSNTNNLFCLTEEGSIWSLDLNSYQSKENILDNESKGISTCDTQNGMFFTAVKDRIQQWDTQTLTCIKRWDVEGIKDTIKYLFHMHNCLISIGEYGFPNPMTSIKKLSLDTGTLIQTQFCELPLRSVIADTDKQTLFMGYKGGISEWSPQLYSILCHSSIPSKIIGKRYQKTPSFSSLAYDKHTGVIFAVDEDYGRLYVFDRDTLHYIHHYPFDRHNPISEVAVNGNDLFVVQGKEIHVWQPSFYYNKQNKSK